MNLLKDFFFSITKVECVAPGEDGGPSYEYRRERLRLSTLQGLAAALGFTLFAIMVIFVHVNALLSGKGILGALAIDIEFPLLILLGFHLQPPFGGVLRVTTTDIRWIGPDGSKRSGLWSNLVEVVPRQIRPWELHFADGTCIPLRFEKKAAKFLETVASCSGDASLLSLAWRDENISIENKFSRDFMWLLVMLLGITAACYSGTCAMDAYYGLPPTCELHLPVWVHVTMNFVVWSALVYSMRFTIARPTYLRRERLRGGRYRRS